MNAYVAGIIFGVLIGVIAVVSSSIRKKKFDKNNVHYDERQLLIRGRGANYGFITVIILNMIYALFFYSVTVDIVSPQLVIIAIMFLGILVDVVYCVLNSAYIMVGQKVKSWIALAVVVIMCNLYAAISNADDIDLASRYMNGFFINVSICVLFTGILIAMVIRMLLDKRGDANEES